MPRNTPSFDTAERPQKTKVKFSPQYNWTAPPLCIAAKKKRNSRETHTEKSQMSDREHVDLKPIKLAILSATGGDINRELLEPAGLQEAGRIVAEIEQTGLNPKDALSQFVKKIKDARAWTDRRLESWEEVP